MSQTFLPAGAAGIGKTRLLVEAKAHAEKLKWFELQGNCFEPDSLAHVHVMAAMLCRNLPVLKVCGLCAS